MNQRSIRVLVVEDSATVRAFLVEVLNAAAGIEVVATAANADEALTEARAAKPDLITMDVRMPGWSGLDATRAIMRECPVPIVIVSGIYDNDVEATFQALDAGALAFVRKPPGPGDAHHEAAIAELVKTVRLMSEIKVVRRKAVNSTGTAPAAPRTQAKNKVRLLAVGASTGGPAALRELLNGLDRSPGVPILVAQHIAEGFLDGFVAWLGQTTARPVACAVDKETLRPNRIYVAPDGVHMGVHVNGTIKLSNTPLENGLKPAVSYLFRSIREAYGGQAAAVLLSGMGKDGAKELLELRNMGAVTFAQSNTSALVFGMPGEAVRLDAAQYVMTPAEMARVLNGVLAAPQAATPVGIGGAPSWPAS